MAKAHDYERRGSGPEPMPAAAWVMIGVFAVILIALFADLVTRWSNGPDLPDRTQSQWSQDFLQGNLPQQSLGDGY